MGHRHQILDLGLDPVSACATPSRGETAMTDAPQIAQKAPYKVELEADKTYVWCACGRSANQPFCDGSHKGSNFTPVKFTANETKTAFLCGCKHSANAPFCDGTHKTL